MTYNEALALIQAEIIANGNNEITANVLRPVLEAMINFPNDTIGVLANLNTTDTTSIVNAINEIISQNLPNATALRPIDTNGIDFNQSELLWVRDAVNQTAANNGAFNCQLGQQMVFYVDSLTRSSVIDFTIQRRYYRLLTGAVLVSAVSESDLMPDGIQNMVIDLSGDLVIDLGDIGTDDIEDAFNSDPNQPFTINGDKFVSAVQGGNNKLWQWIGGNGNFGNSATLAEATDFVDLTETASPPLYLQDLQSVLEQGGYAEYENNYFDFDLSDHLDLYFDNGVDRTSYYAFGLGGFNVQYSYNLYACSINTSNGILQLTQTGPDGNNTFFEIEPPVSANIQTIKLPAPTVASATTHYVQVISDASPPSSSSDTGFPGEVRFDASYRYECIAVDTWIRIPITSF